MAGNDLTLYNGAYAAGKFNNGLSAGAGNCVGMPGPSVAATTGVAVECWVKGGSPNGSNPSVAGGLYQYFFLGIDSTGKARCEYFGTSYTTLSSTVSLTDGALHHLAVQFSSTGAKLFVDGAVVASSTVVMANAQNMASTVGLGVRDYQGNTGFVYPGVVDEFAVFTGVRYPGAFTPPTTAYTGTESGLALLFHLDNDSYDYTGGNISLRFNGLTATPVAGGINLITSLLGGTGTGYAYSIYRGTDPNFTKGTGSLLATVGTMPFLDTTGLTGVEYFYGIVGTDSSGTIVNALPAGVAPWSPSYLPYVAAMVPTDAIALVALGDSITYSYGVSNAGTTSLPTMVGYLVAALKRMLGTHIITASNQGHSGYTARQFAPGTADYSAAKAAMTALLTATPSATPLFSVMLGSNDSSYGESTGVPSTPVQYSARMKLIVDQLLTDFPNAKVVLHASPYYTPNTKNSATYEQAGLSVLFSYRPALTALVAAYGASNPGRVFLGDMSSFAYFSTNYAAELQADGSGSNGLFYLHPSGVVGSNGLIGTQTLGTMHAAAIAQALYGAPTLRTGGFG